MSLSSLPNELLRDIVSNFGSQDLCNLAACSRYLNRVMTPILYRDITISEEVDKNYFALDEDRRRLPGPLHKMACLLLARPDLAAHVRILTFSYVELRSERISKNRSEDSEDAEDSENDEESEDDDFPQEPIEPGRFPKIKTDEIDERLCPDFMDIWTSEIKNPMGTAVRALRLSPDEERKWLWPLTGLRETRHELMLALLLSALLGLEKLVLDLKSSLDAQFLEKMMRKFSHRETPFESQAPLQALKVFVHTQSKSNARNADFINSLLRFPDIHEIFGVFRSSGYEDNGASSIRDQNLAEIASSSSSVCHINMASYNADIKDIFRAPKALKTLTFTDCSLCYLSLQKLRGALAPQEDHLERLIVGYDPQWEHYFLNWFPKDRHRSRTLDRMATFVGFKSLKVLKIPVRYLVRSQTLVGIFPNSLETLHLTFFQACSQQILRAIEHLLTQQSSEEIASLKRLIVEYTSLEGMVLMYEPLRIPTEITQEVALSRLSTLAARHGVTVEAY